MTTRRKLQVEDLLAIKLAGDCQISPDGSRVAYTVQEIDKEKNEYKTSIWVAREGKEPVQYTGGAKDNSPRWSPDGRYLAFVTNRSGSNQIWLLPLEGGEARQLTRIKGGAGNPVWSPDGKYIAFTANLTEEGIKPEAKDEDEKDLYKKYTKEVKVITRILYKMDGVGYYSEKKSQVCVIAVDGGEPVQLTTGAFSHSEPCWTPDSAALVFTANRMEDADYRPWHTDIWLVSREGGELTRLTPGDGLLSAMGPSVSPDGNWVAFIGTDPQDDGYGLSRLYLLDRQSGAIKLLSGKLDRPFGNECISDMAGPAGGKLTWSPDGHWVFAPVSDAGQVHLVKVGAHTGVIVPVTGGDKAIHAFSLTTDCRRAALAYATPTSPSDVYLARLDEPQPEPSVPNCCAVLHGGGVTEVPVARPNAALLEQIELSVPERFLFSAGDGAPRADGWVMKPAGFEPGQKYPAVLEIHGGPMGMYGVGFFYEFQWLTSQGYAVVFSNPRGSQGYGYDFGKCIIADWGNLDYADVMAAMETAVERFDFIDSDRLGVAGGSYGGFMVNWIVGHTDRFKAAVTMRSVVNRWSAMGTSDTGYNRISQFGTENWWEEQNMAPYLKQSPLLHASKINTPLLIEHQEGDLRCPIEQAEQLYAALKLQKKPVKFVRYPGEFHGMSRTGKPWHRIHRLNMLAEWFGEYLKP
ncbi:MAG TPA: S9 family peptidase [Symbiobacteriaceae bacterium]|nr:S9 family peptidase [Symbiobacteriaceae bacterium]